MIGERIRILRTTRGVNQVQLAQALHVSKQAVSNWENNNILPSVEMLVVIADYFGVSTDNLLERDTRPLLDVSGLTEQQIAHLRLLIDDLRG